jgi:hypothetical protein
MIILSSFASSSLLLSNNLSFLLNLSYVCHAFLDALNFILINISLSNTLDCGQYLHKYMNGYFLVECMSTNYLAKD